MSWGQADDYEVERRVVTPSEYAAYFFTKLRTARSEKAKAMIMKCSHRNVSVSPLGDYCHECTEFLRDGERRGYYPDVVARMNCDRCGSRNVNVFGGGDSDLGRVSCADCGNVNMVLVDWERFDRETLERRKALQERDLLAVGFTAEQARGFFDRS